MLYHTYIFVASGSLWIISSLFLVACPTGALVLNIFANWGPLSSANWMQLRELSRERQIGAVLFARSNSIRYASGTNYTSTFIMGSCKKYRPIIKIDESRRAAAKLQSMQRKITWSTGGVSWVFDTISREPASASSICCQDERKFRQELNKLLR